jgi:hypothetical protein
VIGRLIRWLNGHAKPATASAPTTELVGRAADQKAHTERVLRDREQARQQLDVELDALRREHRR